MHVEASCTQFAHTHMHHSSTSPKDQLLIIQLAVHNYYPASNH